MSKISIKSIVTIVCIGIFVFGAWKCNRLMNPKYEPYASSDSPDGKYRCVVLERVPPLVGDDDFYYRLTIVDLASGKELPGNPLEYNMDSTGTGAIQFDWSGNSVCVDPEISPYGSCQCQIKNGRQEW